jgi:hypothetical protein
MNDIQLLYKIGMFCIDKGILSNGKKRKENVDTGNEHKLKNMGRLKVLLCVNFNNIGYYPMDLRDNWERYRCDSDR